MVSRLVLGCGTVGQRIVEGMIGGRVVVIESDPDVVESLRAEGVRARRGDPTDPSVLEAVEDPSVVLVAGDRTDRNRAALELASERFPDASLVAYLGGNHEGDDRRTLETLADHVVDPARTVADRVLDRSATAAAERTRTLCRHLAGIDGRLAVVTHDNPDPDAIASAVALSDLAAAVGTDAVACYYGEISHQENRAMVNALGLELRSLEFGESLEEFAGFALVDHSRPGVNDGLPEEHHVDVVIDHHPPRGPVQGEFVELRSEVGATSTVLTEFLDQHGLEIDRRTATALLYGIRVDTNDFSREVSQADFRAAAILLSDVDVDVLSRIEEPTIEGDTLDTIARAIKSRTQRGSIVVASAGRISDRDALPQAADQLLNMAGVDTTLVFGFRDDVVYISARSRTNDVDLGATLRDAFDPIGSAGGHANMAGAQLEIGVLGGPEEELDAESIVSAVEEVVEDRFFEAIETRPGTPVGAYSRTSEWLFGPEGTLEESD